MKPSISRFTWCAALLFAVALSACGKEAYLADGGRPRQICDSTFTVVPVKVQDSMGQPIPDAQVIATNSATGKMLTATTGGDGRTTGITEELGNGQIQISASAGALSTHQSFVVQLVCG